MLRYERKLFRDKDKSLKVGETDELMMIVIFVMVSSLTVAYVLRLEDREFQGWVRRYGRNGWRI